MPSQPPLFLFANLPVELQREILWMSALENTRDAIELVRVSKKAYHWISPIIYNMVTLGSADTVLFMRTLDSKPAGFFAINVKSLCLSISVEPRDAERILAVCTGVRSLAFWVDYLSTLPSASLYSLISPLSLRNLSIEVQHLHALCHGKPGEFGSPGDPWHARLIQLDIVFWEDDEEPGVLSYLTQLKSLSRLGLWNPHGFVDEGFVSHILDACERLDILLLVIDEDEFAHNPPAFQDPRVVLMPYPAQIIQDWEASFTGQPNTWSLAMEIFFANVKARHESDGKSGK
ncbi:hypothetical protein AGABI1DRAFT_44363 [Agaricus bisporus var. burnettii JB137-S8]|uniref:F-box domain-containing protein n=1 Tax=Agaricus bisporus var. burnettii (strain JB137-S8 / ATCC MYA-4627 / FGSC 10392) TaxID=597362 RepID=K5XPQ8_AGABU|nr:uncharacterized protein AGABI1DRAFT_44363 [Agaricus bisporus var. burnettii JB137-S8]EKM76710.1 hypothetical protein AGABI1DRAFT_44363 [Agaricus bisporus var. burnettii JB137-S8]